MAGAKHGQQYRANRDLFFQFIAVITMTHYMRKRDGGFSLVELMVAMVLGLFLLLSLGQMFLSTSTGSRSEKNISRMQEAGRVGVELLAREIRKAGYVASPFQSRQDLFPVAAPFQLSASVAATSTSVSIRYYGNPQMQTCTGQQVPSGSTAVQTITLAVGTTDLVCSAAVISPAGVSGAVSTLPFVPDVEAIFIRAGEDTNIPADAQPDRYVEPSTIVDWTTVTSLNIQMRVVSPDSLLSDAAQAYRDFNGALVTPGSTDRRLRRVYGTVLSLRNLKP
jgi:type IV pilus assembly protein PilW